MSTLYYAIGRVRPCSNVGADSSPFSFTRFITSNLTKNPHYFFAGAAQFSNALPDLPDGEIPDLLVLIFCKEAKVIGSK